MVSNMNDSPDLIRHARKNPSHSILVETIGTRSNRDGIGTKVRVVCGGRAQYDEVRSGGSYLSSSDLRLHFGLAAATRIDRLELLWPSGHADVVENPPVDRILIVKKWQGLIAAHPFRKAVVRPGGRVKSKG